MHNLKIKSVQFMENYMINIYLSNGHQVRYDLSPKMQTARFQTLLDQEIFSKGKIVEGKVIRWPEQTELSINEIIFGLCSE